MVYSSIYATIPPVRRTLLGKGRQEWTDPTQLPAFRPVLDMARCEGQGVWLVPCFQKQYGDSGLSFLLRTSDRPDSDRKRIAPRLRESSMCKSVAHGTSYKSNSPGHASQCEQGQNALFKGASVQRGKHLFSPESQWGESRLQNLQCGAGAKEERKAQDTAACQSQEKSDNESTHLLQVWSSTATKEARTQSVSYLRQCQKSEVA